MNVSVRIRVWRSKESRGGCIEGETLSPLLESARLHLSQHSHSQPWYTSHCISIAILDVFSYCLDLFMKFAIFSKVDFGVLSCVCLFVCFCLERADGEEAEWGAQQAWPRPRQPHSVLQLWAMCAQGMFSWATCYVFSLHFHWAM